jgi:formiminoglutamase
MKTIPQKCFRPYQKKQMIVYVTIHTTASVSERKRVLQEMAGALEFIKLIFGIEIDLDAIPNIASSAMTLSGFSVEELRQFISFW